MPFDAESPMKTALMTTAAALALYDAADNHFDRLKAAAALADAVRADLGKPKARAAPKAARAPSHLLNARNLAATLTRMKDVVDAKATIPILTHVLLTSRNGSLEIRATDLDNEYVEILKGDADLPDFQTTAPHRELLATVKGADGPVSFAVEPVADAQPSACNLVYVGAGGATVRLTGHDAGDFPVMLADHEWKSWTMPADDLRDALGFVLPSISSEETRYYLNGAFMHIKHEAGIPKLAFTSTDGHRMAHQAMSVPAACDLPSVIIPRALVEWLVKHLAQGDDVQIDACDTKVRFTTTTGSMVGKVIDGAYPDYSRVIPHFRDATPHTWGFDNSKALAEAMKRICAAGAKERSYSTKFTMSGGRIIASRKNMDGALLEILIDGSNHGGHQHGGYETGFNAAYFGAVAAVGGAMTVQQDEPNLPALVTWADRPDRLAVLMPLRV
jgi:DNA polymerase-3 subunit beta